VTGPGERPQPSYRTYLALYERAWQRYQDWPTEPHRHLLLTGVQLLFSAALGAGYGALHGTLRLRPLYGLGIYALTLGAAGPSLGVTPGPWNQKPLTVGRQLMMHAVYGAVTALAAERVGEAMAS
jgi:hypothetical protein